MKNKFCPDTKLTEEEFLSILWGFSGGMTASQVHDLFKSAGNPVSRQTVARKYTELGYYLWDNAIKHAYISMYREANADDIRSAFGIENYVLDTLWKALQGTLNYGAFREIGSAYPGDDILPALKARWVAFNGFGREHFAGHVAVASLMTSQPSHEIRYWWFIKQLLEKPLDSADI